MRKNAKTLNVILMRMYAAIDGFICTDTETEIPEQVLIAAATSGQFNFWSHKDDIEVFQKDPIFKMAVIHEYPNLASLLGGMNLAQWEVWAMDHVFHKYLIGRGR